MGLIDFPAEYLALAPLAGFPEAVRARPHIGKLRELATRFLAWRAERETIRLLSQVDRATLRDLGIADIESQVHGDPRDRMRGYDRDWWKRRS
ncbi:MAG TPA: hypothetical protein VK438_10125 [Xanthobacteraceae bacterium]|nr:hypothetical protein [Xanthobacteraceae bacterium]